LKVPVEYSTTQCFQKCYIDVYSIIQRSFLWKLYFYFLAYEIILGIPIAFMLDYI